MRKPKYLSHSSLSLWLQNKEQFYLKYLSENRPPKFTQTQPMSVGSAFDAHVKVAIDKALGLGIFIFDELFEKQVEACNRDWARVAGQNCFDQYTDSGALQSLLVLLKDSPSEPQMEFTSTMEVERGVAGSIGDVVILGIPDLMFFVGTIRVILDWKVNGYCSKTVSVLLKVTNEYEQDGTLSTGSTQGTTVRAMQSMNLGLKMDTKSTGITTLRSFDLSGRRSWPLTPG